MEIEKLTPIQYEIICELSKAIATLGGKSDIQSVLGSWGDTLPQSDVLAMLKQYNSAA